MNFILLIISLFGPAFPFGVIRHGIDKNLSLDLASKKEYDCVGKMMQLHRIKGSCVLIAPRVALTAAHTLVKLSNSPLFIEFDSLSVPVDSFVLHPWYSSNKDVDLAILYLAKPVHTIKPAVLNTTKREIHHIGTSIGYGNFSVANNPRDITEAGRFKSAGQNQLDSLVGKAKKTINRPQLYADFDHPDTAGFNRSGSPVALEMEYGLDGGDSGGGMFINLDGKEVLAGINAIQNKNIADIIRTKSFYGSSSQWVRVSIFRKWIKKMIRDYERIHPN